MKRIGAIIAIFLLISMYITSLICALIGSEFATQMLQASVFCTIFIPVILYAYIFLMKAFNKGKLPGEHEETESEENIEE